MRNWLFLFLALPAFAADEFKLPTGEDKPKANYKERDSIRRYGMFNAMKLMGEAENKPDLPTPVRSITITEDDLKEETKKKLGRAKFSLTLLVPSSASPAEAKSRQIPGVVRDCSAARSAVERGENVTRLSVGCVAWVNPTRQE